MPDLQLERVTGIQNGDGEEKRDGETKEWKEGAVSEEHSGISRSSEEGFGRIWGLPVAVGQHLGRSGALGLFGLCKAVTDPLQVAEKMTEQREACASHYQCPVVLTAAVCAVA